MSVFQWPTAPERQLLHPEWRCLHPEHRLLLDRLLQRHVLPQRPDLPERYVHQHLLGLLSELCGRACVPPDQQSEYSCGKDGAVCTNCAQLFGIDRGRAPKRSDPLLCPARIEGDAPSSRLGDLWRPARGPCLPPPIQRPRITRIRSITCAMVSSVRTPHRSRNRPISRMRQEATHRCPLLQSPLARAQQ